MRHQNKGFKLGRTHAHREATLAALSSALIEHKRIRTTATKAKALRMYVEPLITRSKDDTTHNRREVFRHLQSKTAVTELFGEVASKIGDRPGGYTRVVKLGPRAGDSAEMAIIELVDYNEAEVEGTAGGRSRRTRRGAGRGRRGKKGGAQTPPTVDTEKKVTTTETVISEKNPATGTVEEPVSEEVKKPVPERTEPNAEAKQAAEEASKETDESEESEEKDKE